MLESLKKLALKTLPQLAFFYKYLKYRIVIYFFLSLFVGILDGFGLAMFVPLLEFVSDKGEVASANQLGNLSFIVDFIAGLGLKMTLDVVLCFVFLIFVLKGLASWGSEYLNAIYQQYFIKRVRVDNINALLEYDYHAFAKSDAGQIQNTLSGEVERVTAAFSAYMQIIQQLVLVLSYMGLAFMSNPGFAIVVVFAGLGANLVFKTLFKKTKELSKSVVESTSAFQGLLIQTVAFFKYLTATASAEKLRVKLLNRVGDIEQSNKKMGILNALVIGLRDPLLVGIVCVTIFIETHYLGGKLATIILSLLFFYRGLSAVAILQPAYNRFLVYSGSMDNMRLFLADLQSKKKSQGTVRIEVEEGAPFVLREMSFAFGDFKILKSLDLSIEKNETVAFVGESGSGKTTLMNVLTGLLQPTEGHLLYYGHDVRGLDYDFIQRKIGYITQEPVIFDDTVYNNVTFWAEKNEANVLKFNRSIEQSKSVEFVEGFPDKEETRLGNNGINLSGGQKQRISIARELYKDIEFLFMDEATSALDSETERHIQSSIDSLKGKYTIIIIAHRLSTIKNADRVVVMKAGEIEQVGKYAELIEKSDSFRRMVELQEL
jgi:subfamily B ATP-binding cassette protein MsbA